MSKVSFMLAAKYSVTKETKELNKFTKLLGRSPAEEIGPRVRLITNNVSYTKILEPLN